MVSRAQIPLATSALKSKKLNSKEKHLGTVFPVVKLASVGCLSVIGCCVCSHFGHVGKILLTVNHWGSLGAPSQAEADETVGGLNV